MKNNFRCFLRRAGIGFNLMTLLTAFAHADEVRQLTPTHRAERVLMGTDQLQQRHYLAFPDLVDLGDEVLVSFKRGRAHGGDAGAVMDMLRIDKRTDRVVSSQTIAQDEDKIMQMGEWVRFPNGDIGSYIDAQQAETPARTGMVGTRSTDGGWTFSPPARLGPIDGVEYGYPFEFVVEGDTTWMLAMSFSNLAGGYSTYPLRPEAGQVSIIRSADSGRTWKFVRNLSREFGDIPINESSLVRYGDGFLVATRGYDNCVRLHATDNNFKMRQQVDLTQLYPFIENYVGRPRLFARDGQIHLLGRNWTENPKTTAKRLCLFRIDPVKLAVGAYAILDNAEGVDVTDGYYPVPYFRERDGQTYLRIVDYKGVNEHPPQIMEFEYLWDEVR